MSGSRNAFQGPSSEQAPSNKALQQTKARLRSAGARGASLRLRFVPHRAGIINGAFAAERCVLWTLGRSYGAP